MDTLFCLRIFKYLFFFVFITFASNYCSYLFKKNIANNQFVGNIDLGIMQFDKSQLCMVVIGILATQLYSILNIQSLIDNMFNKFKTNEK